MKAVKLSRKIHKWFALVLGIQLFLWALSGFYMVVVNIDIIHGDMLVRNMQATVSHDDRSLIPLERLALMHPDAQSITLKSMMDQPVYLVTSDSTLLLDAHDGRQLSPLDEQTAIQVARYHYEGEGNIRHVELLENNPPTELQTRPLPLWRIDFDDAWNSSFYIDPHSSEFETRRHTLWRVFDFMWMLHVMDYDAREDINNTVLRLFSILGVLLGMGGVWLLFYSFNKNKKQEGAT
jgi:PepSY-associated transmembrane protein